MATLDEVTKAVEPLSLFAKRLGMSPRTVWVWVNKGRLNRFTGERIRLTGIRLPNGGWGFMAEHYKKFLDDLNEQL